MKDFETLNLAMENLKNLQGEARIDINIPVCGKAFFDCVQLNLKMLCSNASDISFENFCHPHVSLKLGKISSINDLEQIMAILKKYFSKVTSKTLSCLPLLLKQPAQEYYFCEIEDEKLMEISRDLDVLLADFMQPPKHPICKENLHHITIGYRNLDMKICDEVLGQKVSDFCFDRVCISLVGNHGVCMGTLKTYYLK